MRLTEKDDGPTGGRPGARKSVGFFCMSAAFVAAVAISPNCAFGLPLSAPSLDAATLRERLTRSMDPPGAAMPSDLGDLDKALADQDYPKLTARLRAAHTSADVLQDMNWERAKVVRGASFIISYDYMYDLWRMGSALPEPNASGLKVSSVVYLLYNIAIIMTDGPKCSDPSAPGHRLDQLIIQNRPIIQYMKTMSEADRTMAGTLAIALEAATAPRRQNDDVLCSGGMAQMVQSLKAQGDKPLPASPGAPGSVGQSYAVPAAPGYKPSFLSLEQWKPKQEQARQQLPLVFTKMLTVAGDSVATAPPR
jgi:hypothetical protein